MGEVGSDQGVRLVTPRLVLRDFMEEDWPAAHAYRSDLEVARFLWGQGPQGEEETRAWLRELVERNQRQPREGYLLAIVLRDDGRLIGQIRIAPGQDFSAPGELGMGYLLNRAFWGQGYATEAAGAIVDFVFETLDARQISAWCNEENRASARVLEKAGLRLELREASVHPKTGERADSLKYTIFRDQWHP